jgi:Bacterial antitoxin of type II TA system, VapB
MKTTIDIPDESLSALLRLSRAKTKREAILAAVGEYNRRHEIESLVATFGTWKIDTNEEIEAADLAEAKVKR